MPVIDSHFHVWDWQLLGMPDFPPEMEVLRANYSAMDFKKEIDAVGVAGSVLVGGYPLSFDKHEWYFDVAETADFITGVVAWVDMLRPETAVEQLRVLATRPKFVGIRHILDLEPDPDWMLQPEVMESFRELARRGIPFDMCVNESHLQNILKLLAAVPDLRLVIDHIGKPPIAKGDSKSWEQGMREIAKHELAFCKVSGIIEEADWKSWSIDDLRPYVEAIVEMFGVDRLMFGSNWPVCRLAAEYGTVWQTSRELLADLTKNETAAIFGKNAVQIYRLPVSI